MAADEEADHHLFEHLLVPARVSTEQVERAQELAVRAFVATDCEGMARVDMFVREDGEVLVNELNTIPGSFSFYLWEPVGLSFPDLMDELIDIALAEHAEKQRTTRVFESNLLALRAEGAKT